MSNPDKKLSPLAIASVALGLLGSATVWIFGGLLLAGAGAVLGHLALHDIRFSEGKHSGKRLAITGLVISYLAMASFPLFGLGAMATLPMIKELKKSQISAQGESSRKNASRLFIACEQYSRSNNGKFPGDWNQLEGTFISRAELNNLLLSPYPGASGPAFELVPHERPVLPAAASSVVVIQEDAPSAVEKIAIVHADGSVDLIENPNR